MASSTPPAVNAPETSLFFVMKLRTSARARGHEQAGVLTCVLS